MKISNPTECYETDGTRFGSPVYCTVNAYGDCPYCDQEGKCHIANPVEDCDDFAVFFESWDEWLACDDYEPEEPGPYLAYSD